MRVVLRFLAPLLGLGLAAAGVLLAVEVVAAWVRTPATAGLVVPWPSWRAVLATTPWAATSVALLGLGVALAGLLVLLVGSLARRHDIALTGAGPAMTVTTSPRALARLVGRWVRAADDVAEAAVTASARRISVKAQGWKGVAGPALRGTVAERVGGLLDEVPLVRRPRVRVTVRERQGVR